MKKLAALLSFLITISFITIPAHADCRGYCSRNGGVVCIDGVTKYRDGSPLLSKSKSKDYNKCGVSVPALALNENREPVPVKKPMNSMVISFVMATLNTEFPALKISFSAGKVMRSVMTTIKKYPVGLLII